MWRYVFSFFGHWLVCVFYVSANCLYILTRARYWVYLIQIIWTKWCGNYRASCVGSNFRRRWTWRRTCALWTTGSDLIDSINEGFCYTLVGIELSLGEMELNRVRYGVQPETRYVQTLEVDAWCGRQWQSVTYLRTAYSGFYVFICLRPIFNVCWTVWFGHFRLKLISSTFISIIFLP